MGRVGSGRVEKGKMRALARGLKVDRWSVGRCFPIGVNGPQVGQSRKKVPGLRQASASKGGYNQLKAGRPRFIEGFPEYPTKRRGTVYSAR